MEAFDLFNVPLNRFCYVDGSQTNTEKGIQSKFSQVFFFGGSSILLKTKRGCDWKKKKKKKKKQTITVHGICEYWQRLEGLEKLGIIEKKHSPWVSPTVCVKMKNKIRSCADYSIGLNDGSKQIDCPLQSGDAIFARLNGGLIFSKLDLSKAILQIPVDEKCAEILTINTHEGLFKFRRLPFGIKVAPAVLQ